MADLNLQFARGHYAGGRAVRWYERRNLYPADDKVHLPELTVEVAGHRGPGDELGEWRWKGKDEQ